MGTNYYWTETKNQCSHCGRADTVREIHIGKSSAGWCFSLHVMPDAGIRNLEDWKALFLTPESFIKDECGERITPNEMISRITDRERKPRTKAPYMYSSWEEFDRTNESQEGPNGLIRHRLNERCVSHGDGTWDCIIGEFS